MLRVFARNLSASKKSFDVIVVGAGSSGTPFTYYLAKKGLKALCIEKNASQGQGDNKCAIGGIRASHSDPAKVSVCLRSLDIIARFKEEHDFDVEWVKGGYLFTAYGDAQEKAFRSLIPMHHANGLVSEFLDKNQMLRVVPGLNGNNLNGGLFTPNDGSASPMLTNRGFRLAAEKTGAEFLFRNEVARINTDAGTGKPKVTGVTLKSGEIINAPIVVDAAGKYSPDLQPTTDWKPAITPDSHEAGITEPVERFFEPMVICTDPGYKSVNYYFYPNAHGQIVFCYTPAPAIIGHDREETSDFLPVASRRILEILPRLKNIRIRRTWRGIYTNTPDGLPYVGFSNRVDGLFHSCGFAGHGYMLGPGVGDVGSNIIVGKIGAVEQKVLDSWAPNRTFKKADNKSGPNMK